MIIFLVNKQINTVPQTVGANVHNVYNLPRSYKMDGYEVTLPAVYK